MRRPFKGLERNPYLWNVTGDDAPAAPPEVETPAAGLVRRPFRPYARRPQLGWHGAVEEGVEAPVQRDDVGGRILVVPNWDRFRLARAARFAYWGSAKDVAPPAEQPEIRAPFLVRVPFRALRRNPYLRHHALDAGVAVEGLAPFFVRRPFKALGRNPYLRSVTRDEAPAAPLEAETHAPLAVRRPFKRLGRTPYVWSPTGDEALVAPPTAETPTVFAVRRVFRAYSRNPYTRHSAHDESFVAPPVTFNAAWAKGANVLIRASLVA